MTVIIIREILRWNMILVWILPSELRVMSVTLLVFWDKGWLLLDTESLVSEPLSWSSWTSSWMGTFSRIVFCLPRPTVLQWKHNTNYTRGVMQSLCNRSRNCLLYIYIYIYAFSRRFYPTWLTVHSGYTFVLSVCVFPGNRTHNLCAANAML